jgi:pimeloyl-ACP methyl ester carboxylesterase
MKYSSLPFYSFFFTLKISCPPQFRHYRVVRRDARGYGRLNTPSTGYDSSVDTILSEIVDTLDQLRLPKAHFLGESTGWIIW